MVWVTVLEIKTRNMKLLTKNSIYFLLITSVVFFIGGNIFYNQLQKIMDEEATEQLYQVKHTLVDYIKRSNNLPGSMANLNDIRFELVQNKVSERLFDTVFVDDSGESYPMKMLYYPVKLSDYNYRGIIGKSMMESDDLIETISWSFVILMLVLIVVLLISNYVYSKLAWKPFLTILNEIKTYDVNRHKSLTPLKATTTEFIQLADAVNKMTLKISSDFENMKAFTENASHELQTPLAIIQTKAEQLLQIPNLTAEQRKQVYDINQTANRLGKLNQTLLLFAKIENNQFQTTEKINLTNVIEDKLEQFEELIVMKGVKLTKNITKDVEINIHPVLAEILVSNLLSNAIKYVDENGKIVIELSKTELTISNTGKPIQVPSDKLFERFFKFKTNSESTGLGLALVKQIAILNEHKIIYNYKNEMHNFNYCF